MKNIYLFFLLSIIGSSINAQQAYDFTYFEAEYQPISDGVPIAENTLWSQGYFIDIDLEMPFEFGGETFNFATVWSENLYFDFLNETQFAMAFYADMWDLGYNNNPDTNGQFAPMSPIQYQILGDAGERVLILQYENAGFVEGSSEDAANFQIHLYEADNSIEYRYGPSNVVTDVYSWNGGLSGPLVGLFDLRPDATTYLVEGNPSAPNVVAIAAEDIDSPDVEFGGLEGTPPEGMVYRFAPEVSSIDDVDKATTTVKAYPNPVTDNVQVTWDEASDGIISIIDLQGSIMETVEIRQQNSVEMDLGHLPAGLYVLQLESETFIKTIKLQVQ